jgi:hypothetical protein
MDLKEIGCGGVHWILLALDRNDLLKAVMKV